MYEKFRSVGISHESSPISIREKLALSESETTTLLERLNTLFGITDLYILSTCNRTEVYYSADQDLDDEIIAILTFEKSLTKSQVSDCVWNKSGMEAINHLFRVALGLEAKVLGDIQISNQVKRAYQKSADLGLAGPLLHRIMHAIFYANKKVVQETQFRDGAASVSYAASEIIETFIRNFEKARILILGTGEIGRDLADNLRGTAAEVTLANRTYEKAVTLAHILDFKVEDFDVAIRNLSNYDVVATCAGGGLLVNKEHIGTNPAITQKLLIDLSVPRNIDPVLEKSSGILLYNLDQIEESTKSVLEKRKAAALDVEQILNESVGELEKWAQEMEVSPTIKKLKTALERIRQEEIARHIKNTSTDEAQIVDKVTKSIIQKVIKLPVLQLKAACKRGEAETLVDVLNDLFDLEKESQTNENE